MDFQPVITPAQVDRQQVAHPGQTPVQGGPVDVQQCCTDLRGPAGTIGGSADQVDLDSVNASWLAGLPHHAWK